MTKDYTGYIVHQGRSWWYITGMSRGLNNDYLPVTKCNVNGKLFTAKTGLRRAFIEGEDAAGRLRYVGPAEKVSTAGQACGVARRKLLWLKKEIESHVAEYNELLKELDIPGCVEVTGLTK